MDQGNFPEACKIPQFSIEALNFTTYGSGLVHIAENGKPVTPLYNYSKPYPRELLNEFLTKYGGREKFSTETASPILGFLNSGLQLYWIRQRKPELFRNIKYSLFFPSIFHTCIRARLILRSPVWDAIPRSGISERNIRTNGYTRKRSCICSLR